MKYLRLPKAIEVMAESPGRNKAEAVLLGNVIEFDCSHSEIGVRGRGYELGGRGWDGGSVCVAGRA